MPAISPERSPVELFKIYVKTLAGECHILNVRSSMSVDGLKQAIHDKDGTPPYEQRLIYAGRQMEDGRTLGFLQRLRGQNASPCEDAERVLSYRLANT